MNVLIGCECTGTIRDAFRKLGHNAYSCDLLPDQKGITLCHIQDDILKVLESEAYRLPTGEIVGRDYWDMFIVHPDCTYLSTAAEWCYKPIEQQTKKLDPNKLYGEARREARKKALLFVRRIVESSKHIAKFCMENPGFNKINTEIMRPTQFIHPHDFGHDASKKTGLWLRGLPELEPTKTIKPRYVCKVCGTVHAPDLLTDRTKNNCIACIANGKGEGKLLPRWANQTDSGQNRLSPSENRWLLRATTYQGWADAMADQWGKANDNL